MNLVEDILSLQTLPYPQGLAWPLQASAIAALHPRLVQAPFAEPIFYSVTGLEPSDEERYRSWARPVRKKRTVVALSLTASVHACLGRGNLTLRIPTGQRPLTPDHVRLVAAALPAEPDTTLAGVLEIVDEAIVEATSRLAG